MEEIEEVALILLGSLRRGLRAIHPVCGHPVDTLTCGQCHVPTAGHVEAEMVFSPDS